jgi:carbamoylphosphate synthase large subunit
LFWAGYCSLVVTAAATMAAASVSTATAVSGKGVFAAAFVLRLAHIAFAVAGFISLEMVEALRTASRKRAAVAVPGIVAVVDVAVKTAVTVEPGARAEEDAAHKPVGAVVAIGRAVIRSIVEISVRAHWCNADVDANLSRDL